MTTDTRRWSRRARNRHAMWRLIGWAAWFVVAFGLLIFAGSCLGTH